MPDWSFQAGCVSRVLAALQQHSAVMFVSPTGSGKSRMMADITADYMARGKIVVIYTHRKVIHRQLFGGMSADGFEPGVIASGKESDFSRNLQIVMLQTASKHEFAWSAVLDKANLAIFDEAHCDRGNRTKDIITRHKASGCRILGVTATPDKQGDVYDHLVLGPSPAALREAGVLVPVDVYAPSEIDMRGVRTYKGDFSGKGAEDRLKQYGHILIGNILEHWRKHNPYGLPTVCFAPSVGASVWLRDMFLRNGVRSEHLEANTPEHERETIFAQWRARELDIVTNFGILQEGFDFPGLHCCIMARPTKSLATYIQILGRIRRASRLKSYAIVLDHVGNWYRHPGALDFHDWTLDENGKNIRERLKKESKGSKIKEILCVECSLVYQADDTVDCCPCCGTHKHMIACHKCGERFLISKEQPICPCGHIPPTTHRKILQKSGQLKLASHAADYEFNDDVVMIRAIRKAAAAGYTVISAYTIAHNMLGRRPASSRFPFPAKQYHLWKAKRYWRHFLAKPKEVEYYAEDVDV